MQILTCSKNLMPLRDSLQPDRTVHLCIDMQNLFGPGGPWHTPWADRVLPNIQEVSHRHSQRTVFTRFIPPANPEEATGAWRRLYRDWQDVTRERLDPATLELLPELMRFVPPARCLDKSGYSAFFGTGLAKVLKQAATDALVITGAETDICVLSTALHAVELGLRTVIVTDAVCSSADGTHDALMKVYHERLQHQIEVAPTAEVIDAWR